MAPLLTILANISQIVGVILAIALAWRELRAVRRELEKLASDVKEIRTTHLVQMYSRIESLDRAFGERDKILRGLLSQLTEKR